MPEILAQNIFWNLVGLGPWVCGGLTFLLLISKSFSASEKPNAGNVAFAVVSSIVVAVVVAVIVGAVFKPMHEERFPHRYVPAEHLQLGPKPGSPNYRPQ